MPRFVPYHSYSKIDKKLGTFRKFSTYRKKISILIEPLCNYTNDTVVKLELRFGNLTLCLRKKLTWGLTYFDQFTKMTIIMKLLFYVTDIQVLVRYADCGSLSKPITVQFGNIARTFTLSIMHIYEILYSG